MVMDLDGVCNCVVGAHNKQEEMQNNITIKRRYSNYFWTKKNFSISIGWYLSSSLSMAEHKENA